MNTSPLTLPRQISLDEALEFAKDHAEPSWYDRALRIVRDLCESRQTFTTDHVHAGFVGTMYVTHDTRALGAIMRTAAREGWCSPTGEYVKSSRPDCHRRPIAVWRSEMYASDFLSQL